MTMQSNLQRMCYEKKLVRETDRKADTNTRTHTHRAVAASVVSKKKKKKVIYVKNTVYSEILCSDILHILHIFLLHFRMYLILLEKKIN